MMEGECWSDGSSGEPISRMIGLVEMGFNSEEEFSQIGKLHYEV